MGVYREAGHPLEVPEVARHHLVAARKRGAGDEQVGGRQCLALSAEPGIDSTEDPNDRQRDGERRDRG